jgi:hypothetical protein
VCERENGKLTNSDIVLGELENDPLVGVGQGDGFKPAEDKRVCVCVSSGLGVACGGRRIR